MKTEEQNKGPFFEDFKVGQTIKHPRGRTITDVDNIWFTLLTCNTNQIHFNKMYTKVYFSKPPFNGRLVVNSILVFAVVLGLSVIDTSENGVMLGMTNWKVVEPTFASDTLTSQSTVTATRESKSHPEMGLVTVKTVGLKNGRNLVIEFERTFMVRKAGKQWRKRKK
ncbi:MAG: MaoC family dehydratase [Thaumarchaeota archaeon]|nr:MaoC family dehydratase [Nitrososphaerota archaeon]